MDFQNEAGAFEPDMIMQTRINDPIEATLIYKTVATPTLRPGEKFGISYSILCVMLTEDGEDYKFIYDVTRIPERAKEIIGILCSQNVTPCTAESVIYDII